ncbi:uncharacterized protein LOC132631778 [Lycium barbarum]|uniref:uncharacterized protein LOC132631778 n=1 Tax=Lycium barbarum TaxID=112863 RepID=UPI00293EBF55|nr:uncharacterized protein LOC132631778 [Lycium barbarum]
MKKLSKEMSTLDTNSKCTCLCTCGGKIKIHGVEQDRRLIHFLIGLNKVYTNIKGNILMMNLLPSMAQSFSILSQEEKQREVRPNNHTILESTSLSAFGSHNTGFRTNHNSYKGASSITGNTYRGPPPPGNSRNTYSQNNNFYSQNWSNLFCDHCKRPEHTRDRCYKIHGYPSNFKFTKGRTTGSVANVYASEADKGLMKTVLRLKEKDH